MAVVTNGQVSFNPFTELLSSNTFFKPVAGVNEVDNVFLPLKNKRGRVMFTLHCSDDPLGVDGTFWVEGGIGTPEDRKKQWRFLRFPTPRFITLDDYLVDNEITISTTAPLIVRTYVIRFNVTPGQPPHIRRTAGALVGVNTLQVIQTQITNGSTYNTRVYTS